VKSCSKIEVVCLSKLTISPLQYLHKMSSLQPQLSIVRTVVGTIVAAAVTLGQEVRFGKCVIADVTDEMVVFAFFET